MRIPKRARARSPRKPTFTMVIDEALRAKIDRHRDVNWSEVCRAAMLRAVERMEARR